MEETGGAVPAEDLGKQAATEFPMKLKEGGSVSEHIKTMTEIFEALALIGDAVNEEDRVVQLLVTLPESYNVLVTALETLSENVPKWELVTERLLHEELKLREKATDSDRRKALVVNGQKNFNRPKKHLTCYFCHKPGHIKKECRKFLALKKEGANTVKTKEHESYGEALVTMHALAATSKSSWIVDSGATCHMCNNKYLFAELQELAAPRIGSSARCYTG